MITINVEPAELRRRIRLHKSYTEYLRKFSKPNRVIAYREGFEDGFETVLNLIEGD